MPTFKSSNDLRGEVRYDAANIMTIRLWRGDTEIKVSETTANPYGLDFVANLSEQVEILAEPVPADVAALAALSPEEIARRHKAAEDAETAKKEAAKKDESSDTQTGSDKQE